MMRLRVLTLMMFLGTSGLWSEPAPPAPGMMVDLGDRRLHLDCKGEGSPTVVIAGAGFSFDWYLVQTEVARFARVCTYDPSGTAWSTSLPGREPSAARGQSIARCSERVDELRQILERAGVSAPYVLVGFSIGGLYARLFANRFPQDVSAMVIVDHAFVPRANTSPQVLQTKPGSSQRPGTRSSPPAYSPPVLIESAPIEIGFEDDENFSKLPAHIRELHRWATSLHPARPDAAAVAECHEAITNSTVRAGNPLQNIPLVVIGTDNSAPGYEELQTSLLALSRNSVSRIAHGSSHMIIIDSPEVVVQAIRDGIAAMRNHSKLTR